MRRNPTRLPLRCACGQRLDVLQLWALPGGLLVTPGGFPHYGARKDAAMAPSRPVINLAAAWKVPRPRHGDYDRVGSLPATWGPPDPGFSYRCGKCGATPCWRTPTVYDAAERALERGARQVVVGPAGLG